MRDRFFLDTNIFVYTFDSREPKKKARAQDLVSDALTRGRGVISHQVVQEFLNVATQKFANPLSESDALVYLDRVSARCAKYCRLSSSIDTPLVLQQGGSTPSTTRSSLPQRFRVSARFFTPRISNTDKKSRE